MNGFLGNHHRTVSSGSRTTPERRLRQDRAFVAAFLLAVVGLAITLILGPSSALARQTRQTGQGANSGAGNAGDAPAQSSAASTPSGNAENGKRIFAKDGCYECHDRDAQGGGGTGPRLAQNPITFSAFVQQLRHPASQMLPYTAKVLSDAEVADLYAYLHSIPKAPAASSIPLLQDK